MAKVEISLSAMAKPIWQPNQKKFYAQAYLNSPPFMNKKKKIEREREREESYRMPTFFFLTETAKQVESFY